MLRCAVQTVRSEIVSRIQAALEGEEARLRPPPLLLSGSCQDGGRAVEVARENNSDMTNQRLVEDPL